MDRAIKWFLILLVVFFAGRWGVERFMEFADARYAEREEMARQVGELKAEQMRQTIDAGNASRAEALRQQLGTEGNALQGVGTTSPVSVPAVRRQLDEAQSRRSDSLPR